ncbi:hypothetical protein J7M00_01865 [bacterium]|nr:hypothetical protein [bacterium]
MKFTTTIILLLMSIIPVLGSFSGSIYSGFRYDSNVCKLSDYDLDRFTYGQKDFLLETSDDGIMRSGFSLRGQKRIDKIRLYGKFFLTHNLYIRNGYKNYLLCGLGFTIRRKNTRIKISGSFIPEYASRAYIDDDTDSTKWASYMSAAVKVEIRQKLFSGIYVGGRYEFRMARYNDYFPEYDSQRNGFCIFLSRYRPVKVEVGYYFYKSSARGYDTQGETKENSDESDISYEQDKVYLSSGYDTKIASFSTQFDIDISGYHRVYTSEKPYFIDPLHLGREEFLLSVSPSTKIFITQKFWTKFSFDYFLRKAHSEYNPDVSKLRDYSRYRATITFGYDF